MEVASDEAPVRPNMQLAGRIRLDWIERGGRRWTPQVDAAAERRLKPGVCGARAGPNRGDRWLKEEVREKQKKRAWFRFTIRSSLSLKGVRTCGEENRRSDEEYFSV